MALGDLMDALGISGANAFAGFSGGIVHIFWYRKTKPFDAMGALAGGALTAMYVGEPVAVHAGLPVGLVCFFIGLAGSQAIAPIISMIRERVLGGKTPPGAP